MHSSTYIKMGHILLTKMIKLNILHTEEHRVVLRKSAVSKKSRRVEVKGKPESRGEQQKRGKNSTVLQGFAFWL